MKTRYKIGLSTILLISALSVNSSCRQVSTSESEKNITVETVEDTNLTEANQSINLANFSIQAIEYSSYEPGDEEAIEVVYPRIKALDNSLSQYVNGMIQSKVIELFGEMTNSPVKGHKKKIKVKDDASQRNLVYIVDLASEQALSITLKESSFACCGAAGSEHVAYPYTFDLSQRQLLTVGDIVEPTKVEFFKNVVYRAAKSNEEVSPSALEAMEALIGNMGTSSFQLHKEGVRLILPNFGGHWTSYITVDLNFDDYPSLFKEEIMVLAKSENK